MLGANKNCREESKNPGKFRAAIIRPKPYVLFGLSGRSI